MTNRVDKGCSVAQRDVLGRGGGFARERVERGTKLSGSLRCVEKIQIIVERIEIRIGLGCSAIECGTDLMGISGGCQRSIAEKTIANQLLVDEIGSGYKRRSHHFGLSRAAIAPACDRSGYARVHDDAGGYFDECEFGRERRESLNVADLSGCQSSGLRGAHDPAADRIGAGRFVVDPHKIKHLTRLDFGDISACVKRIGGRGNVGIQTAEVLIDLQSGLRWVDE